VKQGRHAAVGTKLLLLAAAGVVARPQQIAAVAGSVAACNRSPGGGAVSALPARPLWWVVDRQSQCG
jgi:hypothetical protein